MTVDREHRLASTVFVLASLVTIGLFATPQLRIFAYPLVLLSTLVHELGHGVAALLVGGSFVSFELWSDGSGVAHTTSGNSRLADAFVAAGGLVGPAIAAALSFLAGRRPGPARAFLALLCVGLLLALIFVVRNAFGLAFIGGFALCLAVLVLKAGPRASQVVLVFLGTQLALSVYSRGDYLFDESVQTAGGRIPSDVALISNALLLPHWFWGLICGAVSIAALLVGVRSLWTKTPG